MQSTGQLPSLIIDDWPDFPNRGFMHDVSRGKVPRLKTLKQLVDWLALLKYNQLQLYVEHTYAFSGHPLIGRGHSPLTAADLRALDDYCNDRQIELVPNLQSFGHATHILKHRRYRDLAESDHRGGWTLSPAEPGTYELLRDMFSEYVPNFRHSKLFNVNCDETYDVGKGKSAALAAGRGVGRVYLDHLLKVHKLARRHRRRMMFWGDVINRYPELVGEIPSDVILLNWWYEAHGEERGYRGRLKAARAAGLEHWVCPGTSSWNSLFFRMTNARINLRKMARAGQAEGAAGYLVTDWGDNGHYNFLGASLWPMAYGADCAWRAKPLPKAEANFDRRFSAILLRDPSDSWLAPLRSLGDLYLKLAPRIENNSAERWLLTGRPPAELARWGVSKDLDRYNKIRAGSLGRVLREAESAAAQLQAIDPPNAGIELVRREWLLSAELAAHAMRRALLKNYGIGDQRELASEIRRLRERFEELWLERNRRSDLARVSADFAKIERDYRAAKLGKVEF